MKKLILLSLIFSFAFTGCNCGKGKEDKGEEVVLTKKYARHRKAVFKDREMKKWLATLDKAEPVDLLSYDELTTTKKPLKIAEIRLTTGKKAWVSANALADRPVVFLEETKARVRNNPASRVGAVIPKGTIGFIIDEKANWVQVYAGKIDGKWVTRYWVKEGFSGDESLLSEALDFERTVAAFKKAEPGSKAWQEAEEALKKIQTESTTVFRELAQEILNKSGEKPEEKEEESSDSSDKEKSEDKPSEGC